MDINLDDPSRSMLISSKAENEVREIFYEHWEKMKTQMKGMIDGINAWRSRSIQEINLHADQQMRVLEADYNIQRANYEKSRRENIETAKAYNRTKANDPFQELCNACRTLKFQLAELELAQVQQQSKRPIIITVEDQRTGRRPNQSNPQTHGYGERPLRSIIGDASVMGKASDYDSNSFSQSPSSSNKTNILLNVNSTQYSNQRSVNNSNTNSNGSITSNFDSSIKCPICFMIFPSHMTSNDRNRHVDEHMLDGEDPNRTAV